MTVKHFFKLFFIFLCEGENMTDYSFSKYLQLGLSVIPIYGVKESGMCECGIKDCSAPGKHPPINWRDYTKERMTPWSIASYAGKNYNVGIVTGQISGVMVLDIDGELPDDFPDIPKTWQAKTAKGMHVYFKYEDGMRNRAKIKGHNIDFRAEGGYVVAPPSLHATGTYYEWINEPLETDLAAMPEAIKEYMKKEEPAPVKNISAPTYRLQGSYNAYIEAAFQKELEILQNTGEGGRNDQLNKSAFALSQFFAHGLSETQLINELTSIAHSIGLKGKEVELTIKSGLKSGRTQVRDIPDEFVVEAPAYSDEQIASLLENSSKVVDKDEAGPADTSLGMSEISMSEICDGGDIPQYLIDDAPAFIGELISWILDTSLYPQPILALAAAIPCAGNIMAHKVKTEINLRSNFYTLGIAESGAGKEHARQCIERLYAAAGIHQSLLGDPASSTAVINSVVRAQGRGFMRIDEFGRYLASVSGSRGASHTQAITTNMMHMYNNAGQRFIGQEYANNELAGGRGDIDQPCLNVYATTVPSRFYKALSSDDSIDGFLSRWIIFESTRFDVEPRLKNTFAKPPKSLVDAVQFWTEQPSFYSDGIDEGDLSQYTTIKPRIARHEPKAREMFYDFMRTARVNTKNAKQEYARAIWNRAAEHAGKLALLCVNVDTFTIEPHSMQWAIDLATWNAQTFIKKVQHYISENHYEAELKKVLNIVREEGGKDGITRYNLTRKTQYLDRRKRGDIIANLVEAGQIMELKQPRKDGKGELTIYRYLF